MTGVINVALVHISITKANTSFNRRIENKTKVKQMQNKNKKLK